jgi:glutamate 5-kinase
MRENITKAKRIVVKVGTSTLTHDNGKINLARVDKLSEVLSDLMNQGLEIILVTSGAVGVGMGKLKLSSRPKSVRERQAAAAVGQSELMHLYSKFFSEYGHIVGQILLTKDVVEHSHSRNNVINTFETLLEKEIIPIVNENDSVATEELEIYENHTFGDNDTLSAIVSTLVKADLLILLSDIDGFYNDDPNLNKNAKLIHEVFEISNEVKNSAKGVISNKGTGGMATKINAAKICLDANINMIIAHGKNPEILYQILKGDQIGTLFHRK